MKKNKSYGLYKRKIKFARGLSLIFSCFMAYYLNSMNLSNYESITGYTIVFLFSMIFWGYLNYCHMTSSNLSKKSKKKTLRKNKKKNTKKKNTDD